jgi:hypothetical protein
MSDYSDYSSDGTPEDENGEELSISMDTAINTTLLDATTGRAIQDKSISIESALESRKNKSKEELLAETKTALSKISEAAPEGSAEAFLRDYFAERQWENPDGVAPNLDSESDDLEEIDEGLEFERRYNFRHEEEGSDIIPTNPRRIEGEERVRETSRKRKRREEKEESQIEEAEVNRRLDEIDEKYRLIAEANSGKLTNEQLHEWVEETSTVLLEGQGDPFPYVEVGTKDGLEKSLRILEGGDEEEEAGERRRRPKSRGENRRGKEFRGGGRGRGRDGGFRGRGRDFGSRGGRGRGFGSRGRGFGRGGH